MFVTYLCKVSRQISVRQRTKLSDEKVTIGLLFFFVFVTYPWSWRQPGDLPTVKGKGVSGASDHSTLAYREQLLEDFEGLPFGEGFRAMLWRALPRRWHFSAS